MDKNSAEYKTVINLYNDGKISAEERDKLLAALGFEESNGKRLPDADEIFSDDDVYVNLSDGSDDSDEADDDEKDGFSIDIDDGRSLDEFLNGVGRKVFVSAKKGMKTASAALDKASDRLRDAALSITRRVADELDDVKNGGVVDKRKSKTYDMPYDELEIEVKYMCNGNVFVESASARDADKIKAAFADRLNDAMLQKLEQTLDSGFTGKCTYAAGDKVLKITVAPPEDDD